MEKVIVFMAIIGFVILSIGYGLDYCVETWAEWHNAITPIGNTFRNFNPADFIVEDVDHDGLDEYVYTLAGSGKVYIMENISGGWVQRDMTSNINDATYAMAFGDVDNDGDNETVVGGYDAGTEDIEYYKNESGGHVRYGINNTYWQANAVAVGDADNDGLNEVVSCEDKDDDVVWTELKYWKNESGGWEKYDIYDEDIQESCNAVEIGDADNDGLNEVVTGWINGSVMVHNNISGGWTSEVV